MHDTEAKLETTIDPSREADWSDLCRDPEALSFLIHRAAMSGNLGALIAFACEEAIDGPSPEVDPDFVRHPGAKAAIQAYAVWKQAEGQGVPIEVVREEDGPEPEVLPLSMLGKWVAWSSDGLRIVASAEESEAAIRLAAEAGELEPILHRPTERY